jgi:2-phosphosulfolactate phosphatase
VLGQPAHHAIERSIPALGSLRLGPVFAQDGYAVRFEWGPTGAEALAPQVDVLVIVDVLSFTTAVDIAVGRGARVYPFRYRDDSAAAFATRIGALLAVNRQDVSPTTPYSLSPASLAAIPAEANLVLPSPNGSTISVLAAKLGRPILAGCLRNATAVAAAARTQGDVIGIIGSGERWHDGTLRPALEDLIGAGAIIEGLPANQCSPEAHAALTAFRAAREHLPEYLMHCVSGRELAAIGYAQDVQIASQLNVSCTAPVFRSAAYTSDRAPVADS